MLVKWWLLALPHYIVLSIFVGGGLWLGSRGATDSDWSSGWAGGGLVGLLVLIAAIVLLFTGRYPEALYRFIMGMNRWVLRVVAYAGLMTDAYPPFRLDQGGPDPGSQPARPTPPPPWGPPTAAPPAAGPPAAGPPAAGPPAAAPPTAGPPAAAPPTGGPPTAATPVG